MNSREKGKRGERRWRDELRAQGYTARRGQQFSGSPDSPDVVCDELNHVHFEVKTVEKFNIYDALEQARRDAGDKLPIVAHKRNHHPWMIAMYADTYFRIIRDLPGMAGVAESPNPSCASCPFRPFAAPGSLAAPPPLDNSQPSTLNSQLPGPAVHGISCLAG